MIKDLEKRLVEVEAILQHLDIQYKEKIPHQIWEYISKNKSKDYTYTYDYTTDLENQNLNIDTISILTYINIKYLLNEEQKEEMKNLLKEDEIFAERAKKEKYNPDDLFKKESTQTITEGDLSIIKQEESLFIKFINKIKNWIHNITF